MKNTAILFFFFFQKIIKKMEIENIFTIENIFLNFFNDHNNKILTRTIQ